jgi:hypothetical protein
MAWLPGPMPANTWGWGGVKLIEQGSTTGFYFADFKGDHVLINNGKKRIDPHDVAYFDNSITLPPEK